MLPLITLDDLCLQDRGKKQCRYLALEPDRKFKYCMKLTPVMVNAIIPEWSRHSDATHSTALGCCGSPRMVFPDLSFRCGGTNSVALLEGYSVRLTSGEGITWEGIGVNYCWEHPTYVEMHLTMPAPGLLRVYVLDYDKRQRRQQIQVHAGNQTQDCYVSGFDDGQWVSMKCSGGETVIRITAQKVGTSAVVSILEYYAN